MSNPASYVASTDMHWSPTEKRIARQAFDLALERELDEFVRETKERASKLTESSELWDFEKWLRERRKEIDRDYDFRYSMLTFVLCILIRKGRIQESDLAGLGEEKLNSIRHIVSQ